MTENNNIYYLVDEKFINSFKSHHNQFMKDYYYTVYLDFCKRIKKKALPKEIFFTNMRRKKIKLIQHFCPYCGKTAIIPIQGTLDKINALNYCPYCGKGSVRDNTLKKISSYYRISLFHHKAFESLDKDLTEENIKNITYEVYHSELILLTSMIESILRDYFESLVHIWYLGTNNKYMNNLIQKSVANDFMNIEKANKHFKTAFEINLKKTLNTKTWDNLIDIVNLRNTIVHNHGKIDDKFKNTPTYKKFAPHINNNLIFLNQEILAEYLQSTIKMSKALSNVFEEKVSEKMFDYIANNYFNKSDFQVAQRFIK